MLEIKNIHKSFPAEGERKIVLSGVSFTVQEGEFIAVIGQSGCGKSTLLRIIGGFEQPDSGKVILNGVQRSAPSKEIMMIFQEYDQLFPWMTVRQNMIYALKKTDPQFDLQTGAPSIEQCLRDTGLWDFRDYYPARLSGGMKQRGALARALALRSSVFLMDEPFSSLDAINRRNAQELVLSLWDKNKNTVLFVTHDIDEALFLAQKTIVLDSKNLGIRMVLTNSTETRETLQDALRS